MASQSGASIGYVLLLVVGRPGDLPELLMLLAVLAWDYQCNSLKY